MALLMPLIFMGLMSCAQAPKNNPYYSHTEKAKLTVGDKEWQKVLPSDAYYILREKGTEAPNTGKYVHNHEKGKFYCMGCGNLLFTSDTKFESGTGWPSFYKAFDKSSVTEISDNTHGMVRTEVVCARCGGHLGHVFDDGPQPTGLRYCMNGNALKFEASK